MIQLKAGGGVVFRYSPGKTEPEVLLIYRNGKWDLPKGKSEGNESIEMCAAREVAEETGSKLPALVSKIGTSYHEYSENGSKFGKTTHWFSMILTDQTELKPQTEENIEQISWVLLSEAIEKVGYETLKEILRTFRQQKKV